MPYKLEKINMKTCFAMVVLCAGLLLTGCKEQKSFDSMCQKEARDQTLKMCPRKVAQGITIDSMTYHTDGKVFTYWHTMDDSLYQVDRISKAEGQLRKAICREIINSLELKQYKEHQVSFSYVYRGQSSGKIIMQFLFTPKDYQVAQ